MILLVATALAGGFRVPDALSGPQATTRVAFVEDFDGPTIIEGTLRAQSTWRGLGLAVELPGGVGWSSRWRDAAVGNVVVEGRGVASGSGVFGFGARFTLGRGTDTGWWGTAADAMVPKVGVAGFLEGQRGPWTVRGRIGFQLMNHWDDAWAFGWVDAQAAAAYAHPLATKLALVGEVEALNDPSPLHLRALARGTFDHVDVDLGLALPVVEVWDDPTLQVIGAVRVYR